MIGIVRTSLQNDLSEVRHQTHRRASSRRVAPAPEHDLDSEVASTATEYFTYDEKMDCVLSDPKFGMFSLFAYTLTHHAPDPDNIFCSKLFTPLCALPLLVFLSQWLMFVSIIIYQYGNWSICPQLSLIHI